MICIFCSFTWLLSSFEASGNSLDFLRSVRAINATSSSEKTNTEQFEKKILIEIIQILNIKTIDLLGFQKYIKQHPKLFWKKCDWFKSRTRWSKIKIFLFKLLMKSKKWKLTLFVDDGKFSFLWSNQNRIGLFQRNTFVGRHL